MKPEVEARRAMALTLGFDGFAAFIAMLVAIQYRWMTTGGAPPDAWPTSLIASVAFALAAGVAPKTPFK